MMADPTSLQQQPAGYCVVMPTYNNRPTLADVLERLVRQNLPVIVVDDGCTDGSAEILQQFSDVEVITHATNRGKGAALLSGLERAHVRGFTHAVTIDSDGQHTPEQMPALLAASMDEPTAMVIGVRDLRGGGASLKSRILRTNSNFWVWLETGVHSGDSQSGYRVYPLAAMHRLYLRGRRYDFEVESLVKTIWLGAPVQTADVAVRYNTGCHSHFRAFRDFVNVSWLNTRLVAQAFFIPPPLRRVMIQKPFRRRTCKGRLRFFMRHYLTAQADGPGRLAACLGLGVCMGILPIWGFQMLLAVVAAHLLRLNKLLVLLASNISFGGLAAGVILLSAFVGRLVLGHEGGDFWDLPSTLPQAGQRLGEYIVGSIVLALGAGLVVGGATYAIARAVGYPRRRNSVVHPA